MSEKGTLMLHVGAREVPKDYLQTVPVPAAEKRWVPIGHWTFVEAVTESLTAQGFVIKRERYGLSRGDARLFGVLDIGTDITEQVSLAVGVRSSLDQSFPLGFCAGQRVFVCDNLAFRSELMAKRKHTRKGMSMFQQDIAACVAKLPEFAQAERRRIACMQLTQITDERAESLILRCYERDILSHRLLPTVLNQWRRPDYQEFEPRTLWSLMNAATYALMDRAKTNPQVHARQTMALQALLAPIGADSPDLIVDVPDSEIVINPVIPADAATA